MWRPKSSNRIKDEEYTFSCNFFANICCYSHRYGMRMRIATGHFFSTDIFRPMYVKL